MSSPSDGVCPACLGQKGSLAAFLITSSINTRDSHIIALLPLNCCDFSTALTSCLVSFCICLANFCPLSCRCQAQPSACKRFRTRSVALWRGCVAGRGLTNKGSHTVVPCKMATKQANFIAKCFKLEWLAHHPRLTQIVMPLTAEESAAEASDCLAASKMSVGFTRSSPLFEPPNNFHHGMCPLASLQRDAHVVSLKP